MDGRPSRRLVEQRVRNRLVEWLELAASFEEQRRYQAAASFVNVAYELVNTFDDHLPVTAEVHTPDEREVLAEVATALGPAVEALPDDYPKVEVAQALPEWQHLRDAAEAALRVMARRGRLPEDVEVP